MFGRVNVSLYMLRSFDKGQAIVSARNWWRHFFIQESPHSKKERVQAFGATICGIVWVDKRNFWLVNSCLGYHRPITEQMLDHPNVAGNHGRFPFNKNSCLKFRQFHVLSGTSHSGCTDPTQAAARFLIVLASRKQRSRTEDNNLSNGKGHFSPTDRNDRTFQSRPTTFKDVPNILVGPNRNGPFDLISNRNFPEFCAELKASLIYPH